MVLNFLGSPLCRIYQNSSISCLPINSVEYEALFKLPAYSSIRIVWWQSGSKVVSRAAKWV